MAIRHDIVVEQGATFLREFLVQDEPEDDYRAAIDLPAAAGCTAQGHIHDADENVIAAFAVSVADRVVTTEDPLVSLNGWTVTAGITATDTADLVPARLHYVITVTITGDNTVYRIAEGRAKISPD